MSKTLTYGLRISKHLSRSSTNAGREAVIRLLRTQRESQCVGPSAPGREGLETSKGSSLFPQSPPFCQACL